MRISKENLFYLMRLINQILELGFTFPSLKFKFDENYWNGGFFMIFRRNFSTTFEKSTMFCYIFEFGAVQKRVNLVDPEKCL